MRSKGEFFKIFSEITPSGYCPEQLFTEFLKIEETKRLQKRPIKLFAIEEFLKKRKQNKYVACKISLKGDKAKITEIVPYFDGLTQLKSRLAGK